MKGRREMTLRAKVLTKVEIPDEIEVEIEDTVRGQTVVCKVDFEECLEELSGLGLIDLEEIPAEQLFTLAFALAKHRAIDQYLMSIGVDPHEHLREQGQSSQTNPRT